MQYAPTTPITKHTRQDNALEHPVSKSKHGLDYKTTGGNVLLELHEYNSGLWIYEEHRCIWCYSPFVITFVF